MESAEYVSRHPAELGDYVRRLVRLGIEVNVLIDKLPDKNAMKYLQSIINK